MDFVSYIKPELLVLIPVMYLVGLALKKSNWKDERIPLTLGLVSVFLATLWVLATGQLHTAANVFMALFAGITQGVLAAGASVFANQIYKQNKKRHE